MEYNFVDYTTKLENNIYEETIGNHPDELLFHLCNTIDTIDHCVTTEKVWRYYKEEENCLDDSRSIDSSIFDNLDCHMLYMSRGELFPARSEFNNLNDYTEYLKKFPIKILRVKYYNKYTIQNQMMNFELKLFDEENGIYIFKEYLASEIIKNGGENLSEELEWAYAAGKGNEEKSLENMFKMLKSIGFMVTEIEPEPIHEDVYSFYNI